MTTLSTKIKKSKSNDIEVAILDLQYKQMSEDISTLKLDTKEIKDNLSELKSSLDTLPQRLDERYASKETEDNLKRLNWMVISAVVVALLSIVIKIQ